MTRFKNHILAAFALILSLAGLGFFASVGLAVLGVFALLGLAGAAVALITTALAPTPGAADV